MVARDSFKLSFKLFLSTINLRARSSWSAIETAMFLSRFDSQPESSTDFRGHVMYMLWSS